MGGIYGFRRHGPIPIPPPPSQPTLHLPSRPSLMNLDAGWHVQAVTTWLASTAPPPRVEQSQPHVQTKQRRQQEGTDLTQEGRQEGGAEEEQGEGDRGADDPALQRRYVDAMKALSFRSVPLVASGGYYFRSRLGSAQGGWVVTCWLMLFTKYSALIVGNH